MGKRTRIDDHFDVSKKGLYRTQTKVLYALDGKKKKIRDWMFDAL